MHPLQKCQQHRVALHNFRKSSVTLAQYLSYHMGLRLEEAPKGQLRHCTDLKPRPGRGKYWPKVTAGEQQRLDWITRSLDSKLHSLSHSCMESCNFSKLADLVSKSCN